jgi:Obg family GTPase CgtA-like protein
LDALGVQRVLKEYGVRDGDTVRIGNHELEWTE